MEKTDSYHLPVTGKNILRFAFPTIVMTVFNTFYTMVDGLFVSNLIGMEALSAINLTAPAISLITAISGMLATGGSAVVMKKMGEHKEEEARQDFTLLILTNAVVGAVMMVLGYTLMDTLLGAMGLSPAVFGYCHTYLSNYLLSTIPILLMYNFSLYLIAADKSTLSLICTVAGGVANIILDYVLIALFDMGIQGAAIATGLGYSLTAVVGFLVFRKKENLLHCKGGKMMKGVLLKDLYIAKSNILVTVVSLVVLGFGLSFLLETSALLVLALVASTTAVFISITSDADSKWNKNVITMPVSRGQIIGEKFVFYILLAVLGLLTALIPCLILWAFGVDMTLHSLCLYGSIGISATLLAGGISLPCAYLFDPEKSQIVFMMSFMASTGIIVGIVLLTNLFILVKENILLAFIIVLAISAVWFFISYRIAVKVYQKQDIT